MLFLKNYLMIGQLETFLFLLLMFFSFVTIYYLKTKKIKDSTILFIGLIMGLGIGLLSALLKIDSTTQSEVSSWYGLFGNSFMSLLKLVVLPLVFFSMIRVVISANKNFNRIAIKTILVFLSTTFVASLVTIAVTVILPDIKLFSSLESDVVIRDVGSIINMLQSIIPNNVVGIFAENNLLSIIIFAVMIGLIIKSFDSKDVKNVISLVDELYLIIRDLTIKIMKLLPYVLVPLLANAFIKYGSTSLVGAISFIVTLYICMALVFIIHLIIVKFSGKTLKSYLMSIKEVLLLAFTSRSSLGTLPVTISTMEEKLNISKDVSNIAGSFGANMGMNGCAAVYPTLVVIAIANTLAIPMDLSFYLSLLIVVVLGSIGIAGIPGAATMSIAVVLTGMGMVEYYPLLAVILAVDPILDMGRTLLNVHGTIVAGVVVDSQEK
ncbi:MAG: dicarboxylate/amino acid:cation symporter [Anaerorhabdus sp.]